MRTTRSFYCIWFSIVVGLVFLRVLPARAATPGLPLTEDFTSTNLADSARTTARWDGGGLVRINDRDPEYAPFRFLSGEIASVNMECYNLDIGDVDGNGAADVVLGCVGRPPRLFLNNGTATPWSDAPALGLDIGTRTGNYFYVSLGDIDVDGDLDLLTAGITNYWIFYNNGTTNPFQDAIATPTLTNYNGITVYAIKLADLDRDGRPDLLVGNVPVGQGNLWYFHNDGGANPWLSASGISLDNWAPNQIEVADANRDGHLDVFAINTGFVYKDRRLYTNNGTAQPWTNVTYTRIGSDSQTPQSLAVGDVTGDGNVDVIVAVNYASADHFLYINNGTGRPFEGVVATNVGSYGFFQIKDSALADLDADGDLDLISADNGQAGTLLVYENNGTPTPWLKVEGYNLDRPTNNQPSKVGVGDFNNDGKPDLLALSSVLPNIYFYNAGSGSPWQGLFASLLLQGLSQQATALAVADFDHDGDLDFVSAHNGAAGYGPTKIHYNNGTADPWATLFPDALNGGLPNARAAVAGDVNRDGRTDLVLGNYGETNWLYLNNGTISPFSGVDPIPIGAATNPTMALALADVNGDGWLDLIEGNDNQRNRIFLNRGSTSVWSGVTGADIGTNVCATRSVAIADVNRDGKPDLVVGNFNQPSLLFLNNGTTNPWAGVSGTLITTDAFPTVSIGLGDMNHDGYPDLVAGNQNQPLRLYLNNRTSNPWGGVAGANISTTTYHTLGIQLCDVNRDGFLDVVQAADTNRPCVYINNRTAQPFAGVPSCLFGYSNRYSCVHCADFNADGAMDMVIGRVDNHLMAYSGKGFSTYWTFVTNIAVNPPASYEARGLILVDADGDADLDLVVTASSSNSVLFLNNGGTAPWAGATPIQLSPNFMGPRGVAFGDMNGDTRADMMLAYGYADTPPLVYLNNGTTNPWTGVTPITLDDANRPCYSAALGDLNGDTHPDLVLGQDGGPLRLYLNNGATNPWSGVTAIEIGTNTHVINEIKLADVNGNGRLDILTCSSSGFICLYTNCGTANPFAGVAVLNIAATAQFWASLDLGDADRDGDPDLVAADVNGMNYYFTNSGPASLWSGVSGTPIAAASNGTERIRLYDINRDGKLDVVCGNYYTPNFTICLNNGTAAPWSNGAVDFAFGYSAGHANRFMDIGDVDRDGAPEIVTAGNQMPVLYYEPALYTPPKGRALSAKVNTGGDSIENVRLNAMATTPPNTDIRYYLSNDGGAQWHSCRNGTNFVFPTAGNDLRWRAELSSLSPVITPVLHSLSIVDLEGKTTYTVLAAYGAPVPAAGTHTCAVGSVVSFTVDVAVVMGSTQYACAGWTATGNEPAAGTNNSFAMTMNNPATITWLWVTNYWLDLRTNGVGTVTASRYGWIREYNGVELTANPGPGQRFVNWTGTDLSGADTTPVIGLLMYTPRTVIGKFLPTNWWHIRTSQWEFEGGTPNPDTADYSNHATAYMTLIAPPYVELDASNRYYQTGWVVDMNGDVVSGTGTAATFTVTADGLLDWKWELRYAISIGAGSHGTAQGATNGWFADGDALPVVAIADPYYYFYHWDGLTGPGSWRASNTFVASGPFNALATFRPFLTSNNIPHWWLAEYGLGTNYADTQTDFDHDRSIAGDEYWAGTDPTNSQSVLQLVASEVRQGSNLVLWSSTTNGALSLPYQLDRATDLAKGNWVRVATNLARTPPINSWSAPATNAGSRALYRVSVLP